MHIQVEANRLKVAYENKDGFFKAVNAKPEVSDVIEQWHVFSDFPVSDNTQAIMSRKEYFILCKFEEFFKENAENFLFEEETQQEEDNSNVISLD